MLHTLECIHGCGDCDEVDERQHSAMDQNDQGYQSTPHNDEILRTVSEANFSDTCTVKECDCIVEEMAIPSHGEVSDMLSKMSTMSGTTAKKPLRHIYSCTSTY